MLNSSLSSIALLVLPKLWFCFWLFFFSFSSNVLVKVSFLTDLALLTITEVISNSLSGS